MNRCLVRSCVVGATIMLFLAGCPQHPSASEALPSLATRCESSKPLSLAGKPTGLERCSTGMLHRSSARTCPSLLPRKGDGADQLKRIVPRVYRLAPEERPEGSCLTDSECTQKPHGFCTYSRPPVFALCSYGCVSDDECAAGELCFCDDPVGHCVPASCKVDADCQPPYVCGNYEAVGAECGVAESFACQTPLDQCAMLCRPPGVFCTFINGRRTCADECAVY
jgi:hypothetical protein